MRRLPMLDDVRIASPCSADWNEMVGDDRVRFCGSCEKNVYNLSAMLANEAEALLAERMNGELCVRFYQRADGTMMTQDCPVGAKKKRRKKLALAVAGAGAMAAATATAFFHRERTMMGDPAVAQPPCHLADVGPAPNEGGRHFMGDVANDIMGSDPPPDLTPPFAASPPEGPAPPHATPEGLVMGRRSVAPALDNVKKKLTKKL